MYLYAYRVLLPLLLLLLHCVLLRTAVVAAAAAVRHRVPDGQNCKDYHGAAGTVWDGTGVFSPPQAGKIWAPVVNGRGSHRQFFCSRCDGMGRDNLRLDGTGTGREMSHDF